MRVLASKKAIPHMRANGLVTTLSGANFVIGWVLSVCEIHSMKGEFCNTLYCSGLEGLLLFYFDNIFNFTEYAKLKLKII